jgi:predicted TPR repeat methyltransferase
MFRTSDLISPKYTEMQKTLHAAPRGYGGRGDKWAGIVLQIAMEYDAMSILDYGCGRGTLAKALRSQPLRGIRVDEYDPAIPGKDQRPGFADLVNVTDVLEHIEPDRLENVLAHIRGLARKVIFVVISTKGSNKVLPNGRNAHLIIKSGKWWRERLRASGFTIHIPPTVVRLEPHKEYVAVLTP